MPETLKLRIRSGERLIVYAVSRLLHPNLIQMLGREADFDAFWIDVEHAGLTPRDVEIAAITGRSVGVESFVRIPPSGYALVTQCLESGASGVMAAQIDSAAQAEEFVQWAKFVPRGRRGMNNGGYDGRFGALPPADYARRANENNFVAIQIETLGAVEECDAIAAIDDVDLLFVGPVDLTQALGVTGEFLHPRCVEAIDRVAAACRKHGKHWGAVTPTPEHAEMLLERGCTMLSPTNDVRLVNAGLAAVKSNFKSLFGSKVN